MYMNNSTSKPELVLQKNNNVIFYHTVHKSVVRGESLTVHIDDSENPADSLTNV